MEQKTYWQNSSMVSRKVGNELVLVPIRQNVGDLQNIYTMNEVGVRIWGVIEDAHTLQEIILIISDEYEINKGCLESDVVKFLNQLESVGAVDTK
ncbi:PqqD family protein [Chloroflexota bacterium]